MRMVVSIFMAKGLTKSDNTVLKWVWEVDDGVVNGMSEGKLCCWFGISSMMRVYFFFIGG
jgi:hypothetical protein